MKDAREQQIRQALYLFRSALQSGEGWTERCDEAYESALDALVSLVTEFYASRGESDALRQESES